MNRRRFIKGSLILLSLSITNPRQFIDTIANLYKSKKKEKWKGKMLISGESWRNKILHLHPDKNAPLYEILKRSKPLKDPKFSWWGDRPK
ncbi:hypothetical protein KAX02_13615 [candidate division WOR-3 bacterium]|nr:hypothetical protein [candidate division WOR-3 bacterium]